MTSVSEPDLRDLKLRHVTTIRVCLMKVAGAKQGREILGDFMP